MAQRLKEEVRERIAGAALEAFARHGYAAASVAGIAAAAGVSTGNVYRYYRNKEALFRAALPPGTAERLRELLRRRVAALAGVEDYRTLPAEAAYHAISRESLAFAIENRLRVVILLGRAGGTPYERFADEVVAELTELAFAHFSTLRPGLTLTPATRFDLDQIYRNFIRTLVRILERFDDPADIEQAVERFSRYHRAGLAHFFD